MKSDVILYIGETIYNNNGSEKLSSNTIYTIAEEWDFSKNNPIYKDSFWIFFIYDNDDPFLLPSAYQLSTNDIVHPREKILSDIINI